MKKKKYLVVGGKIESKNDRDVHYISPMQLVRLYGVDPRDCVLVSDAEDLRGRDCEGLTILSPRYDGNYLAHEKAPSSFPPGARG